MHYPVMTERQVAVRWKTSLKTLRRWRLDNEGPVWHKLFHHVRYHEEDILEFERQSAQYWMAILGDGERVPRAVTHPPKNADDRQSPEAPSRRCSTSARRMLSRLPACLRVPARRFVQQSRWAGLNLPFSRRKIHRLQE